MTKVEKLWREFEGSVLKEAGDIQLSEMRMGFVSGLIVGASQFKDPIDYVDLLEEGNMYSEMKTIDVYSKRKREM